MKAAECRLGALASPSAAQRGGASMPRRAARHRAQASTGGTGRASIGATFVVCWLASFVCLQGVPPCMGGDRRQGDIKRIRVARSHADGRGKSGASEAGSRARTSGMDHRRADNSMGDGPHRGSGGAAVKSVGADAPGAVTWEAFAKLCGPQEDSAKAALAGREFEVRWPSATPLPDVAAIVLHCACFFYWRHLRCMFSHAQLNARPTPQARFYKTVVEWEGQVTSIAHRGQEVYVFIKTDPSFASASRNSKL